MFGEGGVTGAAGPPDYVGHTPYFWRLAKG